MVMHKSGMVCLGATMLALLASCTSRTSSTPAASVKDGAPDGSIEASVASNATPPDPTPKAAAKKEATKEELVAYLKAHVPKGGSVEDSAEGPKIFHTVQAGDSIPAVAQAYLDLTEIYFVSQLTYAIGRKGGFNPGAKIEIPKALTRMPRDPKEERLGWPEDKALRGVFSTGSYASVKWDDLVDKVAEHGLNAIVLDGKDYDGYVNYPSKAKVAVETGANRPNNIPDLARAIRFAHWKGVRVIVRIPCFHDPWADKHTKDGRLSIKFTPTNKPIHVDWIDPTNKEAQDYALELAQEALDAGADEIQLDYVRFPVHLSHKVAVLPQKEERSAIMRDFVKRARTITKAANAHLSLDFFGVAATGIPDDIQRLGQHIPTVAPEADAISLMAYPSHYTNGYMGFANPADHAEIVAIGNKAALEQLAPTGAKTIFRTWLQAFPDKVTHYGSEYVGAQAKHAEASGGVGWLMWSPGCEYGAVWGAFQKKKPAAPAPAASAPDKK